MVRFRQSTSPLVSQTNFYTFFVHFGDTIQPVGSIKSISRDVVWFLCEASSFVISYIFLNNIFLVMWD